MTRSQLAVAVTLLTCLALSGCSTSAVPEGAPPAPAGAPSASGTGGVQPFKDDSDVPLTKQLTRGEFTQAIPDARDVVPDYYPGSLHKSMPGEPDDCTPRGNGPASTGWQRSGRGSYDHHGSTVSRGIRLDACQFDTAANAKAAYDHWYEKDEVAPIKMRGRVGEESLFLAHNGSSGVVYGYSRSGTVVVRVRVEDALGDATDAHDVLAATIKRFQQVQAGRRATATAVEVAAVERARR